MIHSDLSLLTSSFQLLKIEGQKASSAEWIAQSIDASTKIAIALHLTSQVQDLHNKGLVHRNISAESCVIVDGMPKLEDSEDQAEDDKVKKIPSMIGTLETIPPERLARNPYVGSWLPDDIYALGCLFFRLATANSLPWHRAAKGFDLVGVRDKKNAIETESCFCQQFFANPSMLSNSQLLESLAYWMMHPNPEARPSITTVYSALQNAIPKELYTMTPVTIKSTQASSESISNEIKQALLTIPNFENYDISIWASQAAHALRHSPSNGYQYISRKASGISAKIHISSNKNWLLFQPKKPKDENLREQGTFKIGRRAVLLTKTPLKWTAAIVYSLVNRSKESDIFKGGLSKELALYEKFKSDDLFPKHLISFAFSEKPYKRLSLYENFPYSFFDWLAKEQDDIATISLFKELCFKIWILYSEGYAHRDIKVENILVSEDGHIKLCDTDSIVQDCLWSEISEVTGTLDNIAPERFNKNYTGSWFPDDVYALGCILYIITYKNDLPWSDAANNKDLPDVLAKKLNMEKLANEGEDFCNNKIVNSLECKKHLAHWMMHPDPTKRPNISQVRAIISTQ